MNKNPTSLRVFFGIPIPEDKAQELQARLKKEAQLKKGIHWTKPENHHITLRFLGNVEEARLSEIIDQVEQAVADINAFELNLRSIIPFSTHRVHFAWATATLSMDLANLYKNINSALNLFDLNEKIGQYIPHITLFRDKKKAEFEKIFLENEVVEVDHFLLYQSVTTETGSIYKPLHRFALKATS